MVDLNEFIEKTIAEFDSKFFSEDKKLPEEFKNFVRTNQGGDKFIFFEYTSVVSSELNIYCPNQWFYIAAYYCKLYPVLKQYKDLVYANAKMPDSSKDYQMFFSSLKDNYANAIKIFDDCGLSKEDVELLAKFVSDYKWWRGGKGIERNDFYYSTILSAASLVNQSQSYVAEICKYLVENPVALNILTQTIGKKSIKKIETVVVEDANLSSFMGKCINKFLTYDTNLSKSSLRINPVTVGLIGCPFGKLSSEFDNNTDFRRKGDCDDNIVWVTNNNKYYYLKEQTSDTFKIFKEYFNSLYVSKFKILSVDNTYKLIEYINLTYRPYITAIKSKPFLLLAGISGTGKSRIVRELARACWDEGSEEYKAQKPSNFEMVQVKPNWHDSSELMGYVSRVSGEPVFVAGDFLKFVAKAWENPDVPYFLCLDEMNLAPVEQYFAEFLSVVESRKMAENGNVVTDPILKKESEQWYFDLVGKLTENGGVQDRFKNDGICIPQNLIIVGTVNMDETTFSFSRKVLDRAMTIEMNEVNLNGGLENKYEVIGKLGVAELIGRAVEGVDVYKAYKGECDTAIAYLQKINDVLEDTPFKIAYRTRNEALLYVVNNLPYNKNDKGEDLKAEFVIARALDEITNMKILSRIEGDETKVSAEFLGKLTNTIKEGLEAVDDSLFIGENQYKSISLAKLKEMEKRLKSGYTSFWG